MNKLRKGAEIALEALEDVVKFHRYEGGTPTKAIQALRQALAQPEQEAFYRLLRIMGTFDLATGHADSWNELLDSLESELRDVLGYLRTRREWVGITKEDKKEILEMTQPDERGYVIAITEAKLKEKNT